jgi:pyruvate dehydrogenase E2 component (dihydrolipoamide acetyltransferase)
MPQLGETVTEGTITKWLKSVGDQVERDEPLFEVSTDKVDSEVPSPVSGTLTAILVPEGDTVDVGAPLAVIGDGAAEATPAPAAAAPAAAPTTAVPVAAAPAPPPPAAPAAPAPTAAGGDAAGVLSPMVRKLLADNDLDASSVAGTGPAGRVTRADVEAAIAARGTAPTFGGTPSAAAGTVAPATPAVERPAPVAAPPASELVRSGRDEVVPFTNIRRRTAEHMVRSKATSAHTLMVKELDYERVEAVRRTVGQRFRDEEGFGLSYLPFAARATVEALREFPRLNASVAEDALVVHHEVNLGIAVDLDDEGLIVPVVHQAEELTLRGMARRIRELAVRARSRQLTADDISGGTFSITNAGPYGTLLTGAIINQPQVAILSTDGVSRRPVAVTLPDGSEAVAVHSVGLGALTFDHRANDGAYAAKFLTRVSEILLERDWAGEL